MSEEKGFKIERANNSMLWEIKFEGGGQIPNALTGLYTSKRDAEQAIARFQSGVRKRIAKTSKTAQ